MNPAGLEQHKEGLGGREILLNTFNHDETRADHNLNLMNQDKYSTISPMFVLNSTALLIYFRAYVEQIGVIKVSAGYQFVFRGKYLAMLRAWIKKKFFLLILVADIKTSGTNCCCCAFLEARL